ncbi:RHS repeat-associated protein [Pseudomonas sp. SJZ078]|uniref:RHS repeat domain-containing protein n=1 Tax=Pseudomonas sp. SJZ078 TaxID=2572886 RepID=UPI0011A2D4B8|nr:RHS repeat-associated core domain-containing protein [Pseudomonas sp. SJZ078]TWC33020.1 RHS repeat-associated protein [Pseudomonas sp. SJZ078]
MNMDHGTPRLIVVDPRFLPVRSVDYCCALEREPAQSLVNRSLFDMAGRVVKQWDPRLWALQQEDAATPANLSTVYTLSGDVLFTNSVDAGWQLGLPGLASESLQGWDGRSMQREVTFDDLLRPVAVFEQGSGQRRTCVERMQYGAPGQGLQAFNQYGQLIRHDDPAGTLLLESFALSGQSLTLSRRFCLDGAMPDWPASEADRESLLEPGDGALSTWRLGPLGDLLEQIDARGNRQRQALTRDGRLSSSQLLLQGQSQWQPLVSEIDYNAEGQIERELAGNDVQTTLTYAPEDGRLMARQVRRAGQSLQHLVYAYDPVGNVLGIEDKAVPVRYFANQRIDPVSRFRYNSLYRLIEASGWEAGGANQGPDSVGRVDPAALSNYRQTYRYDASGNLLELTHVGAQNHGRQLQVARYSNRCLPYRNGVPPTEEEIAAAFDARGNGLVLEGSLTLAWDLRNQLRSVTPVERESGLDDREAYVYDGGGQRVRKLRTLHTGARTLAAEVRYLPGLELRADSGTGESLQVITAQGGLSGVRVLHWDSPPPSGVNDHYRYSFSDHLGSVCLEFGHDGRIISQEHFYPFGETAYLAGDDVIEVSYKTIRYSGKERDATGLYYYGFRYYAAWLQRWINPDPAGAADGLNAYAMVGNNPLTFVDTDGLIKTEPESDKATTVPIIPSGPPFRVLTFAGPPPPPGVGPKPPPGAAKQAPAERVFEAVVLAPPNMPGNVPSASWEAKNHVDIVELASVISELFSSPRQPIAIKSVSQEELFNKIRAVPGNETMEFDSINLSANPAAWTSPEGIIYMGVDSPDYSDNGQLDVDKIRSTIVHESLHYSSYRHVGFQAETDLGATNLNYDEYVTDYFAYQVFTKMFPGAVYKTGYFTKDLGGNFMQWGGNLAKFMVDSGHVTPQALAHSYFSTGTLNALKDPSLSKWKTFAKQKSRPLKF